MARPPVPANLREFQRQFATEEACQQYLARCRWPEGFRTRRGPRWDSFLGGGVSLENASVRSHEGAADLTSASKHHAAGLDDENYLTQILHPPEWITIDQEEMPASSWLPA